MRIIKTALVLAIFLMMLNADAATVQTKSPLGNKDVEKSETAVCDLLADALRSELGTDIAFIAASEVKEKDTPFPAGSISTSDIASLLSYPDDPLAQVALTGKSVKQALERGVSIYPQPNLGFLQVSGLEFTYDHSKNAGERATSVTVGGVPLIESKTYTVAMTNSMANGALGYWKVWTNSDVAGRYSDKHLSDALENYFTINKTIDYSTLDRIKMTK